MKNFIKIFAIVAVAIVAVVGVTSVITVNHALAAIDNDSGTGCGGCGGGGGGGGGGYSQGSYNSYHQGSYNSYSQGSYYSQSSYTTVASCDSFTGNPTTLPVGGGSVTLNWSTTNATSVSIDQGVGTVSADGSTSVNVTSSKTFKLTAVGTGGNDDCTVSVTVPEASAPSCDSFTGNPTTLPFGGGNVNLNWATTNATGVSINQGIGSVSADGSTSVNVTENKTFVLTATNVAGASVTCNVPVTVGTNTYSQGSYSSYSQGSYGGGGSSSPKCDFDISAKKIKKGKEIKLTWNTTRATEVVIKDNHGNTILDTDDIDKDDRKDFYDGDITLKPSKDTTYTLVASKGSKDKTCKVSVDVEGGVTVLEIRDQKPLVTGIKLTQVPYTGFEAGPALTFIFYTLLALWALFIAYTLVLKKKGS